MNGVSQALTSSAKNHAYTGGANSSETISEGPELVMQNKKLALENSYLAQKIAELEVLVKEKSNSVHALHDEKQRLVDKLDRNENLNKVF